MSDSLRPHESQAHQTSLSITNCQSTQTLVHGVGDAIQPSHPLSSPSPPAPSLSQHEGTFPMSQLFPSGGQSIGVSPSTSVLPMNSQDWYFRMDWLHLLAVQGTLKSILQHHSSKASILRHSAFFVVQLSRQSEWLWSKSLQAINAGEGVKKREPSYTVGGNAN